ncbi:NlpC/P60 family protein [Hungatella effluvii]|uniref:NlpC/P60 family protein n=1 Tax=Hungatella effluvii TaxID=1096246 RepID=A0A2V3Y6Z2_9FIRM|nr:NlpC/P60 family protein [Hungatella effluvii]PXX52971.1 NlpC/P60 family protein [Hungatella effluvii]
MKRNRTVRNQTISAIFMALVGTVIHAGAQSYLSSYDIPENKPARPVVTIPPVVPEETKPVETVPETEAEEVFSPSLAALNLAYLYPEGADRTDAQNSLAGQILRELSVKDSEWLASIYDLSNRKPAEAAAKLGLPVDRVRGLYNPLDESQTEDNPDSWLLSEWSRIDMVFTDENGNRIMADSNIKEIMAMANTYFYYTDPEDSDAFLNYVLNLWDKSHSIHYSIGEVYYCDGCLEEASGDTEASEAAGTAGSGENTENASGDGLTGSEEAQSGADGTAAASASDHSQATPETAEIGPGVPSASEATVYGAENGIGSEMAEAAETGEQETKAEIGPGIALMEASKAAEAETAEETNKEEETDKEERTPPAKCPGHVDLYITAAVTGASSSEKSLFSIAEGVAAAEPEAGFPGWTEEHKNAVRELAAQDWKAAYGLTVSSTYISNPLSQSETEYYLSLLPADTSLERRRLIRYALSSVGKVPYYWGGKPSAPDYDGNHFGSLATADEKGRTMKGLDCSGWISWVYWSALGKRLPAESTDGLAGCGTAVAREDLKPGDIIVRLGDEGHVVMFLAWESEDRMKVVHESSGSVNNVTVSTMQASWPYYRKLID